MKIKYAIETSIRATNRHTADKGKEYLEIISNLEPLHHPENKKYIEFKKDCNDWVKHFGSGVSEIGRTQIITMDYDMYFCLGVSSCPASVYAKIPDRYPDVQIKVNVECDEGKLLTFLRTAVLYMYFDNSLDTMISNNYGINFGPISSRVEDKYNFIVRYDSESLIRPCYDIYSFDQLPV